MYQTVGQDAIEYVAQALEVPLYRKVISGTAVDMSSEYGSRDASANGALNGDETEDLHALLATVKEKHPDIEGVSVGAILSNYQRVRVEHVCRRLGLTPLSYLWQRDQRELLSEMIEAGLEAILIKVAGVGLQTKHLGKTLAQMQTTLLRLNDEYGSHVCGEGGEYETLTLDCPLFKRRINLEETEAVIHSDNDFATVAYLRIKRATLQEKQAVNPNPPVPALLEEEYEAIQKKMQSYLLGHYVPSSAPQYSPADAILYFPPAGKRCNVWIAITATRSRDFQKKISLEDEVHECFQALKARLSEYSLNTSHIANINILLSSMDYFSRVNAIYQTYFGSSPASRACVAVDMTDQPFRVKLEAIAYAEESPSDRQALHVQGLSYWAPANIGPYSQAVVLHDQRVFISGQIGLLPYNLTLPTPQNLPLETALACQHVERISRALKTNSGGGWEGHVQLAVYWLQNYDDVAVVREAVQDLHGSAPTLFIGVPALPKGALVEKQVVIHTGRFVMRDEEGDEEVRLLKPVETSGQISSATSDFTISWARSTFANGSSSITVICLRGQVDDSAEASLSEALPDLWDNALLVRVFYRPSESLDYPDFMLRHNNLPTSSIPCKFVSAAGHDDWDLAIYIMGV